VSRDQYFGWRLALALLVLTHPGGGFLPTAKREILGLPEDELLIGAKVIASGPKSDFEEDVFC
jgi:hypothetical protein